MIPIPCLNLPWRRITDDCWNLEQLLSEMSMYLPGLEW